MRRILALSALLCCLCLQSPAAQEEFVLDPDYLQTGMGRSHGQGYQPDITQHSLTLVLPIESASAQGDIKVTLAFDDPQVAPLRPGQTMTQTVQRKKEASGGLGPYVAQFKWKLHSDRLNGEYPYHALVEGRDAQGGGLSRRFDFLLTISDGVANRELPGPRLVSLMAREPLLVGEDGCLVARYLNPSRTRLLTALSLKLSDASGDILPLGSDTLYLPDLLPGQLGEVELPVQVLNKAAASPHALTLTLSAELPEGTPGAQSQQFTLPIYQETRLRFGDSRLPPHVTQGENVAYSLNFMNLGKGRLNNILMDMEVPGLGAGGSVLVGNLAAGESKLATANLRVSVENLGAVKGNLKITYEDDYGKPYQMELPLETDIKEKPKPVFADQSEEAAPEKKDKPLEEYLPWGLAGTCLVLLVIQSVVFRRKIRRLEERGL